jgi:hypothetical protein
MRCANHCDTARLTVLYDAMQGGTAFVLLGFTATVAYSVGLQNVPSSSAPVPVMTLPPMVMAQVTVPPPNSFSSPSPMPPAKAGSSDKPARPDEKRKAETLTAAAIAAILVQISRDQYHAKGKPCACPDDTTRDGKACGGRSAYSRLGGAEPLCYPTDVTATMIEQYRQQKAPR